MAKHETIHKRSFDIAIDMLLRCERFFRDIAFFEGEKVKLLAGEFYLKLFCIDEAILKYKTEGELSEYEYHLLSEINEQLTDYAFCASHGMHPWDISFDVEGHTTCTLAKPIKFPPSTWVNRVERETTTPLTGYLLQKPGLEGDDED